MTLYGAKLIVSKETTEKVKLGKNFIQDLESLSAKNFQNFQNVEFQRILQKDK